MNPRFHFLTAALLPFVAAPVSAGLLCVDLNSPNPTPPYTNWLTAATNIQDAVDAAAAGDLILVTNGVYASGGRAMYGTLTNRVAVDRMVLVQSVNGPGVTVIQGYQVPGTNNGDGAIRCAYLTNGAALSGFTLTNGATHVSGDTVLEQSGGGVWCESTEAVVTNCTLAGNSAQAYAGGAYQATLRRCRLTGNWANFGAGAALCSASDCAWTGNSTAACGSGGGAYNSTLINCTITANWADDGAGVYAGTLSNCTLTGNSGVTLGGGACQATLNNCTLTGNSLSGAYGSASGGGAYNSTLNNCLLKGNLVTGPHAWGGGSFIGTLINCTVVSNSAGEYGGGSCYGTLKNCVIYYNTATNAFNYYQGSLNYCCTTPLPASGAGNIAAEPLFVDLLTGNLRLQLNSPCINAGASAYVSGTTDLDGRPRIVGGTVDIGAYEYQGVDLSLFIAWLAQHGLPTDGSADYTDPDGDGANNWQEWLCDTCPTNAESALRLLPPVFGRAGVVVTWQSVTNRVYLLERATGFGGNLSFVPIATGIPGQAGAASFTDSNAPRTGPCFYRVSTGR